MPYGYEYGNPFGDPNKFTRGTQESEIDRYNQWMRSQPYWQEIAKMDGKEGFSDREAALLQQKLGEQGITIPKDFHIDDAGNFNQKSRLKRNLAIAGLIAGGALTAGGLAGMGPLAGLGGGAGTAGAGGAAAGAGAGGAATAGSVAGLAPALGGGATLGASLPAASALVGVPGSLVAPLTVGTAGVGALGGLATTPGIVAGPGGGIAGASKVGGGVLGKIVGGAKDIIKGTDGEGWGDLGRVIGAYGQSEASNRYTRGNQMQAYDRLVTDFARENRAQESDAMKKLAQVGYITGGGNPYKAPALRSGQTVDLGWGAKAPTDMEVQGASTLKDILLKRLTPEGQLKPTDPNTYTKEGVGEKISKWGSLGAGAIGAGKTIFGW